MSDARTAVAARVARAAERRHVPGIAWGVMLGGELAMSGGVGRAALDGDAVPDATTVFRIASMTKSFTAAAVLSLRDDGGLRLDEPIATYAPELATVRGPTSDSPAITVRHLLSMASGLPGDDAWADRRLDMDAAEVTALAQSGPGFALAPGTAFEYSNLGYTFLGRIVEHVSGTTLQAFVTERFVGPLGLHATTWTKPLDGQWARPYAWYGGGWHAEPEPLDDGAMAPMGGLWSTVTDLARWMAFFDDAYPPRDGADEGPARRATRREQQQVQRAFPSSLHRARGKGLDAVPARLEAGGYAFGLLTRHDLRFGTITGHAGGLPGYGSNMCWLPGRRVGVVALGNVTYAPMEPLTHTILEVLDDHGLVPPAPTPPSDELRRAAVRLVSLLTDWNAAAADALFAENVLVDRDEARRRADARRLGAGLELRSIHAETARRGRAVCVTAEGGEVGIELELSPHAEGRVQFYKIVAR